MRLFRSHTNASVFACTGIFRSNVPAILYKGLSTGCKAGRLGSIPGQVMPKTWKTLLAASPALYSAKGRVHTRLCHWLATSLTFTAKVASWPAAQVKLILTQNLSDLIIRHPKTGLGRRFIAANQAFVKNAKNLLTAFDIYTVVYELGLSIAITLEFNEIVSSLKEIINKEMKGLSLLWHGP